MGCAHSRFTVLFEGPFWIGLYEREEDGLYTVCKVTFGAEPSGAEVYAFLCTHWHSLRFGPAVAAGPAAQKAPGFRHGHKGPAGAGRPARTAGRAEPDTGQALPRGMRSAPFCASPAKAQGKAQGALASLCLFIARAVA